MLGNRAGTMRGDVNCETNDEDGADDDENTCEKNRKKKINSIKEDIARIEKELHTKRRKREVEAFRRHTNTTMMRGQTNKTDKRFVAVYSRISMDKIATKTEEMRKQLWIEKRAPEPASRVMARHWNDCGPKIINMMERVLGREIQMLRPL